MKKSTFNSKLEKGFTLIELVVTLVVLGILAIMGKPIISNIKSNLDLNKSTTDLVEKIRKKQALARYEHRVIELQLAPSKLKDGTDSEVWWQPSGGSRVTQIPGNVLYINQTGGLQKASNDSTPLIGTVIKICDSKNNSLSKVIGITAIGTISVDEVQGCD